DEHRAWDARLAAPLTATSPRIQITSISGRRVRIGYVSPDFRDHPIRHFVEPLFHAHDRERFEVFCYSGVPVPDAHTSRLQSLVAGAERSAEFTTDHARPRAS